VTLPICFKSADSVVKTQFRNQPQLSQHFKIAIHGPLADIGYLFSNIIMYLVSGQMIITPSQKVQNCPSLFRLPVHVISNES